MMQPTIATGTTGSRWQIWMDMVLLIILLSLSTYFVYFTPQSYSRVFFIALLISFFFTKKDYLWFAFFLIIIWTPGYLFSDFSGLSTKRLPLFTFFPGWSFTPVELFLVLAIVKAIIQGRRFNFELKKPFVPILFYSILLFALSFFLYGVGEDSLSSFLVSLSNFSLFFSFSYLVYAEDSVDKFMYLIFPIAFFVIFTQLWFVATGDEFINLLSPGFRAIILIQDGMIRPVIGGQMLVFFSYVFALLKLQYVRKTISVYYLWIIVIVSFLSVFLSATRVWVIMFSFILLCYVLFFKRKFRRSIELFILTALIIIILLINVSPFRSNIVGAWARISEVGQVAQGRFSESSTFEYRFSVRLPRLLVGLRQNWIVGWGISDTYHIYSDGHVGNFNLLLQVGIVGFLLFVNFWLCYFRMILNTRRKLRSESIHRNSFLVLIFSFGAILIAHFSTYSWFGILISRRGGLFLLLFYSISEFLVRMAKNKDYMDRPRVDLGRLLR